MEEAKSITQHRLAVWDNYHFAFESIESSGKFRRPIIPAECSHNAHMYYILLPDNERRTSLVSKLKKQDINSVFHYIPLHTSPAGLRFGKHNGELSITNDIANRLLRLPLWCGVEEYQERVINAVIQELS